MKLLRIAAWALALVLATTAHAEAGPIAAAIGAIAGLIKAGGLVGALVQMALGLALNLGFSLLQRALQKKPPEQGVRIQVEIGDDHPAGFTVGHYATAGTRLYANSFGFIGKTPNAILFDVIQLGDLPAPGQPGIWVNGEKVTPLWDQPSSHFGLIPIEEYRVNGVDHLWFKYVDGTQSTAEPLLTETFGDDPDRPWEDDMVGRGTPYIIMYARLNRDLFRGGLNWLFEPPSIGFYDLRKDSTAGGSGAHRWDDPSTREPSTNPAVIAYNILRGIYYDDGVTREWMFGGQNLPAFRLPAANWMAAMNECDAPIDLEDGGTEPQYRCGYEIRCDMDPLDVVEELLKGFGRVAEVGGRFKIHVGAPGAPVYSFTDADVLVTEGRGFQPFLPLSDTVNGIEATAPFPGEAWRMRDIPALYDEDMEEEDGDRRLAAGVQFSAAPYHVQCQRVMKSMLRDGRRQRVHVLALPPDASLLEPATDVVAWTSQREGYVDKKFTVERVSGRRTRCPVIIVREVDPSDYDWSPGDQQPVPPPVWTGPIRPPVQPMTGWNVQPYTILGQDGAPRRPAIQVLYDGDQDDVRAVRIQVREDFGGNKVVFDGEAPYGEPADGLKDQIVDGLWTLPDADYEVRGIFLPFSGRQTHWSNQNPDGSEGPWQKVKTPNVLLGGEDFYPIDIEQLKQDVKDAQRWAGAGVREAFDEILKLSQAVVEMASNDAMERAEIRRGVATEFGEARSSFEELIVAATGPNSALVARMNLFDAALEGKASVQLLEQTTLLVQENKDSILALGTQLSQFGVELEGKASASQLAATILKVEENEQGIEALGDSLSELGVTVGKFSAEGRFRTTVEATPSGAQARIGISAAASDGASTSQAAIFLDALAGGLSRIVMAANRTMITDSQGNLLALFDEVSGQTVIAKARIGKLDADNIDVEELLAADAFIENLLVGELNIVNGAVTSPHTIDHPDMPKSASGSSISITLDDFANISFATGSITGAVQIQFQCTALMNFFTYRVEARQGSGSWVNVGSFVTGNHPAIAGIIQSAPFAYDPPTPNVAVQVRVIINAQVNAGGTHGFTCNWATISALVHKK